MPIARQEKWQLELTAALSKKVPAEWIFWEAGVCEPARIRFASNDGSWTTEYSPLSGLGEIISYAAREESAGRAVDGTQTSNSVSLQPAKSALGAQAGTPQFPIG